MYLPPLQPAIDSDIYAIGDVTIHPSAVIAPGALLQAAPNSRIVIGEGVCLGMGVILNAYQGSIELENGVILGAGVLIVGSGRIGSNACIGSSTTIFNTSLDAKTIVAPGSIIGDRSRQISSDSTEETTEKTHSSEELQEVIDSPWNDSKIKPEQNSSKFSTLHTPKLEVEVTTNNFENSNSLKSSKTPVAGQVYLNKLLLTIFPQRQYLNPEKKDSP